MTMKDARIYLYPKWMHMYKTDMNTIEHLKVKENNNKTKCKNLCEISHKITWFDILA